MKGNFYPKLVKVFNFPNLLEAQVLSTLVYMKGNFYPKLVKVFYTCVKDDMEGNFYSIVNGMDMVINAVVWKAVEIIDMGGVQNFDEIIDGYSKMQTYRNMLLNPTRNMVA